MHKQCRNCGAELPEDASFCPHCTQSQIERSEVKPPRLWRKKAFLAVSCVLIAAMVILACTYANRAKTYEGGANVVYTDKDGNLGFNAVFKKFHSSITFRIVFLPSP